MKQFRSKDALRFLIMFSAGFWRNLAKGSEPVQTKNNCNQRFNLFNCPCSGVGPVRFASLIVLKVLCRCILGQSINQSINQSIYRSITSHAFARKRFSWWNLIFFIYFCPFLRVLYYLKPLFTLNTFFNVHAWLCSPSSSSFCVSTMDYLFLSYVYWQLLLIYIFFCWSFSDFSDVQPKTTFYSSSCL